MAAAGPAALRWLLHQVSLSFAALPTDAEYNGCQRKSDNAEAASGRDRDQQYVRTLCAKRGCSSSVG